MEGRGRGGGMWVSMETAAAGWLSPVVGRGAAVPAGAAPWPRGGAHGLSPTEVGGGGGMGGRDHAAGCARHALRRGRAHVNEGAGPMAGAAGAVPALPAGTGAHGRSAAFVRCRGGNPSALPCSSAPAVAERWRGTDLAGSARALRGRRCGPAPS